MTQKLTKVYGETFAVLNMANAYFPGGGYDEGMPAQEENMFRRTDCHFAVTTDDSWEIVASAPGVDQVNLKKPEINRTSGLDEAVRRY